MGIEVREKTETFYVTFAELAWLVQGGKLCLFTFWERKTLNSKV